MKSHIFFIAALLLSASSQGNKDQSKNTVVIIRGA